MDENVDMSIDDISEVRGCTIINSRDQFPKGTADEILTKASKENGWIIVTKDIRMALRSLQDGVDVIFINDDFKTISYITATLYGSEKYPIMFDYLQKRFGFNQEKI